MGTRMTTLGQMAQTWQVRCHGCGENRPLQDGRPHQRLSIGRKLTLSWCRACHGMRLSSVERQLPKSLQAEG